MKLIDALEIAPIWRRICDEPDELPLADEYELRPCPLCGSDIADDGDLCNECSARE